MSSIVEGNEIIVFNQIYRAVYSSGIQNHTIHTKYPNLVAETHHSSQPNGEDE